MKQSKKSNLSTVNALPPILLPLSGRCSESSAISAWAAAVLAGSALLAGCGMTPTVPQESDASAKRSASAARSGPALPKAGSGRGGYYQDDGPGDDIPEGLLDTPDAEPKVEPILPRANRPYKVFGKTYVPITDMRPFRQRGIASWYGKKFHGQKTSSGEIYDMYKMTAAHPTLPIPSYARVTSAATGIQIIVRINDRGPFHADRVIDLSYTAALKLGYLGKGSSVVEVERLLPDEIARINAEKRSRPEPQAQREAPLTAPVKEIRLVQSPAIDSGGPADVATVTSVGATRPAPALPAAPLAAAPSSSAPAAMHAVAATPSDLATTAVPAAMSGYYLQLGAYAQFANAEAARVRLAGGWSAGPAPEVAQQGDKYRVLSGPFSTRGDAEAAVRRVQSDSGVRALIVQR